MATQSPFSLASDVLEQFTSNVQPPPWLVDESVNRLLLLLNHVISSEPQAMMRLARQKGQRIELHWKGKTLQLSPTAAGLLERTRQEGFDLRLTLSDPSMLSMATALLRGKKPSVRIEGDVQLASEVNWMMDHLRWDVEEDMAAWMGDATAHTLAQAGRSLAQALRQFMAQGQPSAAPEKAPT